MVRNRATVNSIFICAMMFVFGCSHEDGRILSVGDGLTYQAPAVAWVYKAGRQHTYPPPSAKNLLGLPYKTWNVIVDLSVTESADQRCRYVRFVETSHVDKRCHRRFPVTLELDTGKPVDSVLEADHKIGYVRETTPPKLGERPDLLGDGRYVLQYVRSAGGGRLQMYIGRADQPLEGLTRVLEYDPQSGYPGFEPNQTIILDNMNRVLLSPGAGYLVLIDLSKLPPTQDAATEQ